MEKSFKMNKFFKLLCVVMMFVLSLSVTGCFDDDDEKEPASSNSGSSASFSNKGMKELEEVKIKVREGKVVTLNNQNPRNFRGAQPVAKKPFTLMVYMCGTDLEEETAAASNDIIEMAASKFKGDKLNVVILTGGTKKWNIKDIERNTTNIYTLEGENLIRQATFGRQLLSDPRTLTTFVNYATTIYPSDKYALVFWDHGGGPVWGYGVDGMAKPEKNSLFVPELKAALANSALAQKKAEFIGFDACLMATVETAQQLQDFAKYMVASEEVEPGFGWDWRWLRTLSENTDKDALISLKETVDRFVAFCEENSSWLFGDFDGTLSVTDLRKIGPVAAALNDMGKEANGIFSSHKKAVTFEKGRAKTKSFGDLGDDGNFDLVDLGDYAEKLHKAFPNQAETLRKAVADAVVYTKNSSSVSHATGLTTYFPYNASFNEAQGTWPVYASLYKNVSAIAGHTSFLTRFCQCLIPDNPAAGQHKKRAGTKAAKGGVEAVLPAEDEAQAIEAKFVLWRELEPGSDYFVRLLVDKDVESEGGKYNAKFDGKLMSFQDEFIYVREKDRNEKTGVVTYDSPAYLNGIKVRVLIRKDAKNKDGKIVGALRVNGPQGSKVSSKDIMQIKKGDKLQFRYWANLWTKPGDEAKYAGQPTHKWVKGKELTVGDSLTLKKKAVGKELYLATFWIKEMNADMKISNYYTQKLEMRRK
jgi:hypothetical protein